MKHFVSRCVVPLLKEMHQLGSLSDQTGTVRLSMEVNTKNQKEKNFEYELGTQLNCSVRQIRVRSNPRQNSAKQVIERMCADLKQLLHELFAGKDKAGNDKCEAQVMQRLDDAKQLDKPFHDYFHKKSSRRLNQDLQLVFHRPDGNDLVQFVLGDFPNDVTIKIICSNLVPDALDKIVQKAIEIAEKHAENLRDAQGQANEQTEVGVLLGDASDLCAVQAHSAAIMIIHMQFLTKLQTHKDAAKEYVHEELRKELGKVDQSNCYASLSWANFLATLPSYS